LPSCNPAILQFQQWRHFPTTPLDSMSSVHLSPSTRPSGSLIETKIPPCSPVRSGLTTTLTLSPYLMMFDFQPCLTRLFGLFISTPHVSAAPFAFCTDN